MATECVTRGQPGQEGLSPTDEESPSIGVPPATDSQHLSPKMHITQNTALTPSSGGEVTEQQTGVEDDTTTSTPIVSDTTAAVTTTTLASESASTTNSSSAANNSAIDNGSSRTNVATATKQGSVVPVNGVAREGEPNCKGAECDANDNVCGGDERSSHLPSEEMLIAPEEVKLEEVDSDCCEDTVDGEEPLLRHLNEFNRLKRHRLGLICKEEAEDSNSSCSLSSFSNGFLSGESDASMRKRLFTSLSQSFPDSVLSRVLHSMDTVPYESEDEDPVTTSDRLSSSCFSMIRMEKGAMEDDELTSLTWLQDSDLLKNINAGEDDTAANGEDQKENAEGPKAAGETGGGTGGPGGGGFVAQAHPPHVPYNPLKHVNSKPPYSFSCLIFMAVEESPDKKLPVKDIYNWIQSHFPYFQNAPTGWKNSVRHNLSLNKCFKKVDKDKGTSIGKGSLWCIDPDFRPNLLQMLRKTPYHPYHQLQMMSTLQPQHQLHPMPGLPASGFRTMPLAPRGVPNTVSPHLFPFLSRRLGVGQAGLEHFDREMQDVANTLVAMKGLNSKNSSGLSSDGSDASGPTRTMFKRGYNGTLKQHRGPVIVTPPPSEDHCYVRAGPEEKDNASTTSSIDNEYDFGDDDDDISEPSDYPSDWDVASDEGDEVDGDLSPAANPRKRLKASTKKEEDRDEEEKQEGAKLLLSLAGFSNFNKDDEKRRGPRKSSSAPVAKGEPLSRSLGSNSSRGSSSSGKGSSASAAASSKVSSSSSSLASSQPAPSSRSTPSSRALSRTSSASKVSSKEKSSLSSSSKSLSSSSSSTKSSASSKPASTVKSSASAPTLARKTSTPPPSSSPAPSLPSTPLPKKSASIIMTRRGKAAAEAAAEAAAAAAVSVSRMCTRGKKLTTISS